MASTPSATGLTVKWNTAGTEATLTWALTSTSGVQRIMAKWRLQSERTLPSWAHTEELASGVRSFVAKALVPGSAYEFQVLPELAGGLQTVESTAPKPKHGSAPLVDAPTVTAE